MTSDIGHQNSNFHSIKVVPIPGVGVDDAPHFPPSQKDMGGDGGKMCCLPVYAYLQDARNAVVSRQTTITTKAVAAKIQTN